MRIWTIMALILTLALGLSVGGLVIGYRQGLWKNIARYFLVGLLGVAISAVSMVLIIIAIWPPYNVISFVLTLGFVVLVLSVLYFVRSTNTADLTEEGEKLFPN
ncbi:MAG: hypothetical protein ACYC21_09460 [Eubacteriales bacterium]